MNSDQRTPPSLRVHNLHRRFGAADVVRDVSFAIEPGQIVGLLGPNGAGKTTTVRMCATLLAPTSGTIEVAGIDAVSQPAKARRHLGLVLGGDRGFYGRASARENLLFFADVAGVASSDRKPRVEAALEQVSLTDRAKDAVQDFSRGMKQRLHIARALLNAPQLLLLDEPSNGLDPEVAHDLRTTIRDLANAGTGILLTTHYLAEAEELSSAILIIISGQIRVRGSMQHISDYAGVRHVTTFTSTSIPETTVERIGSLDAVLEAKVSQLHGVHTLTVLWSSSPQIDALGSLLVGDGVQPLETGDVSSGLRTRASTLEESYLAILAANREVTA